MGISFVLRFCLTTIHTIIIIRNNRGMIYNFIFRLCWLPSSGTTIFSRLLLLYWSCYKDSFSSHSSVLRASNLVLLQLWLLNLLTVLILSLFFKNRLVFFFLHKSNFRNDILNFFLFLLWRRSTF
jgi:hypothetical protein